MKRSENPRFRGHFKEAQRAYHTLQTAIDQGATSKTVRRLLRVYNRAVKRFFDFADREA